MIQAPTQPELLEAVEKFLRDSGMTPTALGREALKDPSFVHDLRKKNRRPSLPVIERLLGFMRARSEKQSRASKANAAEAA